MAAGTQVRITAKVFQTEVEKALATGPPAKYLEVVAKEIADTAETIAPDVTGYYKARMQARKFRTWWRVENVDPFAHLVEWGSINNRAYAPIRKAIRAVRIRFTPGPKG